ncbi:DNA/RNA helicase domain-containing protein [Aliarcobacter butzleri]|uniref:DNA/RNA helicase domain-containing protein n=1 Tax=Aliarcobacter butzleri TaxID=28197 RepID=UPI003AF7DB9C
MIVYKKTKKEFLDDVNLHIIEDIISNAVEINFGRRTPKNEYVSWKNSLNEMAKVLYSDKIPNDSNISIEYNIPRTGNRIDLIVSGQDENRNDKVVIIELKQWSDAELTSKDGVIKTILGGGLRETTHPSYQAWSYVKLLEGFNKVVDDEKISLVPCAYLHNYPNDNILKNDFYKNYLSKAPVFVKGEKSNLIEFISSHIIYGDNNDVMKRIDESEIKPSKSLADSMASMIKGNEEFTMIDNQKIVYESALELVRKSDSTNKNVLIVHGGPGTGKSVIAINLLVELTKKGFNSRYVSKNSAPRAVYESKLTKTLKKTEISNLFTGSGSFIDCEENSYDCLIIDEAHRMNEKSGLYGNLGENQIKEAIYSSKSIIFFLDEDQTVTFNDIGEESEIKKWTEYYNANVEVMELTSQFRCNGSDGYLAWIDNMLQIRETANITLDLNDYDFKVFDNPNKLKDAICEKNKINNKARLVAGYCWNWESKKDSNAMDIILPEYGFEIQWNLSVDGSLWIISPQSVEQIGCIHTCQGLEVDYIGVIIGEDLTYEDGKIVTNPDKRAKTDQSLRGYKGQLKEAKKSSNTQKVIEIETKIDNIIKNTYRTLMTRGMKGCYVYCEDKELELYIMKRLIKNGH